MFFEPAPYLHYSRSHSLRPIDIRRPEAIPLATAAPASVQHAPYSPRAIFVAILPRDECAKVEHDQLRHGHVCRKEGLHDERPVRFGLRRGETRQEDDAGVRRETGRGARGEQV